MSSDLDTLSLLRAGLPDFPGSTLPAKLAAGRAASEAILRKYVPNFAFNDAGRDQVIAQIQVWEERNSDALSAALADPTVEALPDAVKTAFGVTATQQFIIGGWTRAAAGIGPWVSGAVSNAAGAGGAVNQQWAEEDAAHRLVVFGSIVKMENDGYMAQIFAPNAAGGFGLAPIVIGALIVIAVVAVAAVVLAYFYSVNRLEANNHLMVDLCKKAQTNGDQQTVAACIQATKDLQTDGPTSQIVDGLAKAGLVVGGIWAFAKWVLPELTKTKAARA